MLVFGVVVSVVMQHGFDFVCGCLWILVDLGRLLLNVRLVVLQCGAVFGLWCLLWLFYGFARCGCWLLDLGWLVYVYMFKWLLWVVVLWVFVVCGG